MKEQEYNGIRDFLHDLSWSGTGIAIALGTDFLFYVLAGRLLGPGVFGLFGTFMAIYYISVGPLSHALEITSKKLASKKDGDSSVLLMPTLKLGILIWLLFLCLTPFIEKIFSLPLDALVIFSFIFPLSYSMAVLIGQSHGNGRYRDYAFYEVFSSAVKFSAIGLIVLGADLKGAVIAPAIEIIAGFSILMILLKPQFRTGGFKSYPLLYKSSIFILAIYAAFSIDILLLKLYMSAETVGLYNAVATIGKAVFFGSVAINRAIFPKFSKAADRGTRLLHLGLTLIFTGGASTSVALALFGEKIISLTFGADYIAAAEFAPLYIIFITLVSAVSLLGNYYLSSETPYLKQVLILPLLQIVGILAFHESVEQIILVSASASLAVFVLLYLGKDRELD